MFRYNYSPPAGAKALWGGQTLLREKRSKRESAEKALVPRWLGEPAQSHSPRATVPDAASWNDAGFFTPFPFLPPSPFLSRSLALPLSCDSDETEKAKRKKSWALDQGVLFDDATAATALAPEQRRCLSCSPMPRTERASKGGGATDWHEELAPLANQIAPHLTG